MPDEKDLQKTSKSVGRPTDFSKDVVTKLESIFKIGGTVEEATSYAGISRQTYYRWLDDKEDFVTKMEAAQHYADVKAKNVVVSAIIDDEDLQTAKWWLEKRQFKNDDKPTQFNADKIQIINYAERG